MRKFQNHFYKYYNQRPLKIDLRSRPSSSCIRIMQPSIPLYILIHLSYIHSEQMILYPTVHHFILLDQWTDILKNINITESHRLFSPTKRCKIISINYGTTETLNNGQWCTITKPNN